MTIFHNLPVAPAIAMRKTAAHADVASCPHI